MHAGLNRSALRRASDAGSFDRGEGYAAEGRVRGLREQGGLLHGVVAGTQDYRVSLGILGDGLACSCTCPVGRDGTFCKHVVALGLTWLDGGRPRGPSGEQLRAHLLSRSKEELVDLLLQRAAEDEWLHGRLALATAGSGGGPPDVAALAAAIDAAVETRGFVPNHEAYDYFRTIDAAIDEIEGLLEDHPAAVVELAEHTLGALEAVYEAIDDSDGALRLAVGRLSDLHLAACTSYAPQPEALAERLFRIELASELEVFHGAASAYAEVLGPAGLARYRRLAEAEWTRIPALGPGDEGRYDGRRFRVTAMMEALARTAGDVDELVEVMARDLSLPYAFLRIAETLDGAGRPEEALAWAERGLAAHPERHDGRLSDFVAEAHLHAGRRHEAMAVSWEDFVARPVLERFERLRARAGGGWPEWREQALAHLRAQLAAAPAGGFRVRARDASELVRVLLAEDDPAAAWGEARAGGCSSELWLELARRCETEHPGDALDVYRRGIEPAVARANRSGYEEAVALLRRMRPLALRLGEESAFGREVAGLREAHRRKRNLVAALDGLGWPEVPPAGGGPVPNPPRRATRAPDLLVIQPLREWTCSSCGGTGGLLTMDEPGPLCMTCAELDHLTFLGAGDAALTRRARAGSGLSAVVVRFSRARRRYERQGILVEEGALASAERQCLADSEARARRRERDAARRADEDEDLVGRLAGRIAEVFPGCPDARARAIALHAAVRGSGRVGRSAAGRALDDRAVTLAVVASIRHEDTRYDDLLMAGVERGEARRRVGDAVDRVLERWRSG